MQGNNQTNNLNNQNVGVTPSVDTSHINNVSAVAANNRQNNVNVNNRVNQPMNNNNNNVSYQGYVEPPKKKNGAVTFLIIFLILAVAATAGYFAGGFIYNATHNTVSE